MTIPFLKAHGDGNDFLFTFTSDLTAPIPPDRLPALARAICQRNTGVGADGWYRIEKARGEADAAIHLLNSDGSAAELSGNGTRCAASILVSKGLVANSEEVRIETGAGLRRLRLRDRVEGKYAFEMEMGQPTWRQEDLRYRLELHAGPCEVAIVDVGNPQCAVVVDSLDFDWQTPGAEIEAHPHFPRRTNVSFLRVVDRHTIEARFYERGAGATLSSGTGSAGAAVSAMLLGLADSPVLVRGVSGEMNLRWNRPKSMYLTGSAEVTSAGEYYWQDSTI